jgi:hypothetical protein
MIGLLIFARLETSRRVMDGPSDDSIPSAPSDFFDPSVRFPETAAWLPPASTTTEASPTPDQRASPDIQSPWLVVVLVLVFVGVIGGTLLGFICARKLKPGIRPTASGQIDEHAAEPLLVPDEYF